MNKLTQAFIDSSVEEQIEFCKEKHRVLCMHIYNNVPLTACGRIMFAIKEIAPLTFEQIEKLKEQMKK